MQGTVKWFSNSKGYGFIGRQDGADVFVHYSGIAGGGYRTLQEGDSVQFEIVQGPKGLQANNVSKIGILPSHRQPRSNPHDMSDDRARRRRSFGLEHVSSPEARP